jgi:diadenosine tetraphosphate (Ap4A) HIT family hydrolase
MEISCSTNGKIQAIGGYLKKQLKGAAMSRQSKELLIFADEMFSLEQNATCPIPGYLVLRLKGTEVSLAQLPLETAKLLGEMLQRVAAAIEQAVKPERVYILSFCEVEPRLHFHLFPRTAWLLKEYFKANDCANDPVNGPMLFEWARGAFGPGSHVPRGTPAIEAVCGIIHEILK